jgi:hypothetical protein
MIIIIIIDFASSGDSNVIKKEDDKILNYKDLIIEIQRVSESLRQYLSNMPGKHE